jgi:hypothetical protein
MSFAIKVDLPDPGLPVIRILGFVRFLIPKLNWFSVWRVPVGIGPGFLAFEKRGRFGQTLRRDESFESGQPMLIIVRPIVGLTAICGGFKFAGEGCRPLFPSKMACLRKLHSERERLCLPWLGEDRSVLVTGQIG